jgi:hypothetical protein
MSGVLLEEKRGIVSHSVATNVDLAATSPDGHSCSGFCFASSRLLCSSARRRSSSVKLQEESLRGLVYLHRLTAPRSIALRLRPRQLHRLDDTFAYRATDKKRLRLIADPIGPENDKP